MPKQATTPGRKPRGAQKLILNELQALRAGEQLATSEIMKRISKAGKKFHNNSVYNALRILVKRGQVNVLRKGRTKFYQVGQLLKRPRGRPPKIRPVPEMAAASVAGTTVTAAPPAGPHLPHKLALGEILVIRVQNGTMVTATNLHGKIVIERHPVP